MTAKSDTSWRALNRRLRTLTEDELKRLLIEEISGQRREFVAERLHQRFTMVRAARERRELMEQIGANDGHDTQIRTNAQ